MKPTYAEIAKEHSGELKVKFLQFLKEHDAFDNYKKNIMKFINKSRFGDVMNILSCPKILVYQENGEVDYYNYFKQLINFAFYWRETPQGRRYWEDLNILWGDEVLNFIRNKASIK